MKRTTTIRVPRTIVGNEANLYGVERIMRTMPITEGVGGVGAFIWGLVLLGLMIFAAGVVFRLVGMIADAL